MANRDIRSAQNVHFDELYNTFFSYYQAALKNADQPHQKVRLQLSTEFFDDLELMKLVTPVFAKFATTPAEKRAVAKCAYYDALAIHNRTLGLSFIDVPAKDVYNGKAKGTY